MPYFLPFSTPYRDSWMVFRDDPVSVRQLIAMRRQDGQARALYRLLTMPILAALKNSDVIPMDGEEGGSEEAEFCKNLLLAPPSMGGMTHTFVRFLKQMLLAFFNGFSAWEMVYWVPETGPNKGKITLRKIDWRPSETLTFLLDGQGEFNGFRQRTFFQGRTIDVKIPKETSLYYACFTGNTRVELLDGTSARIDEVARRVSAGEELWTYSVADGRIVPGRVSRAGMTGHRKLVAVRLDNDEIIRCTPDHRLMLRDGTYREAADLRPGDSLMPLYRRERPVGSSKQFYEQVQQPDGSWEFTHRVVSNYFGGRCKPGWVTHHKNLNHRDNSPGNLERLTRGDHERVHALLKSGASAALLELWSDPEWRARQVELIRQSQRRPETRARLEEVWASEEWRAACRDRERPHARRDVMFEVIDAEYRHDPRTCREVAESLGVDMATVRRRVLAAGYRSWREYVAVMRESGFTFQRRQWDGLPAQSSQVLHRLWEDEGYRADRSEQSSRQLKALWDDPERRERQREALRRGWEKRRARNHKVVSVESAGDGPVYDLTVEDHHNFALSAGVFAHNCNEAERPFYGVSMFESAFFHYDKKVKLYYIAHLAAQRAAVGLRVGTMKPNPNKEDKNNFVKALANLGLAQYIVLPDADWTVVNLKEEGNYDFLGMINHHNSQMSKSILAQWFDDAQGASQGDSALVDFGKQDDATYLMMLDGLLEELAEVIDNRVFPRFVDWNFGTGKYPRFKWGELTAEQKAAIQDTFDKLAVAGQTANVTPEFMLELEQRMAEDLGLEIDYDKIKKEREKQQKLMQQQAKAQAAMMANGQPVAAGSSVGPPGQPPAPGGGGGQPGAPQGGPPQSSAGNARTGPGGPYG